jgi:molecular chaperone GrpE
MSDIEKKSEKHEENQDLPEGLDGQTPTEIAQPETLEEALALISELRQSLAEKTDAVAVARDEHLRDRAEVENFKKRMLRDKTESLRFAAEGLLRDLLSSVDNLERAASAAEDGSALQGLHEGVTMVLTGLKSTLERHGVTRLESVGRPFDPAEHEALAQIPTTQEMPGHVIDEHLPGYRLHDRLLRASQVTVAQAPTEESEAPRK